MRQEGAEFVVPHGVDPATVVSALAEHHSIVVGGTRTVDRTFVDTFDGVLYRAGLVVDRTELPVEGIDPLVGVRALLPVARVRSRFQDIAVLNRDEKTVARIEVERSAVVRRGQPALSLAPRLRVSHVRGYERACERVCRTLTDDLDVMPATQALFDEAVRASGRDPKGTSAKVVVPFDDRERADRAVAALLGRLAEVMDDHLPGTLEDIDPEFLHDYRIAVRQTRALLREMKGVLPQTEVVHFREELRWLQQVTGPLRDLDVHLIEVAGYRTALPASLAAHLDPLAEMLHARRSVALRRMRRALRSQRRQQLRSDWVAFIDSLPRFSGEGGPPLAAQPIGTMARTRARKVYEQMVRLGETIDDDTAAEALHELRRRGKELRYLMELFASVFPAGQTKPLVSTLKALQDTLGCFQDREVQADAMLALAGELARADGGPGALMVVGVIVSRLQSEQQAARADFAARFAPFAEAATRQMVTKTFR